MTPELVVLVAVAVVVCVPLLACWVYVFPILVWDEWIAWSEENPHSPLAHRSAVMYGVPSSHRAPRRSATRSA